MYRYCSGITRRDFIKAGALGVVGLSAADLFRAQAADGAPSAARSLILLWMDGGPPQHETFDPKPGAPLEIRGEFAAIPTNVDGLQVCELMPRMARQMDRVALIRTLAHDEGTHDRARHRVLTGWDPLLSLVHPSFCSLGGGPYGTRFSAPEAKTALDLAREPERVRDAYGRTTIGRNCLLARRLVEAGVRVVTVTQGGWDTHSDHFEACKKHLVPAMDQAFAALLQDLHDRGLLATTLVVWMGEFGRTPWVNGSAGRDHWPQAGCAVVAGAGVRGGQVIGETDDDGRPQDRAISPEQIARTIAHKLGLDPAHARLPRQVSPVPTFARGEVIRELV
jgi:hypothetical protein